MLRIRVDMLARAEAARHAFAASPTVYATAATRIELARQIQVRPGAERIKNRGDIARRMCD